jgi:hypothetical protein
MAGYDHLPIYRAAFDLAVQLAQIVETTVATFLRLAHGLPDEVQHGIPTITVSRRNPPVTEPAPAHAFGTGRLNVLDPAWWIPTVLLALAQLSKSDRALHRPRGRSNMAHAQRLEMKLLDSGRCEPLKAAVHGVLLLTMGVCAAYNAAAWIRRRQRHLAVNAVIYSAGVWWEGSHIAHHLAACDGERAERVTPAHDLPDAA